MFKRIVTLAVLSLAIITAVNAAGRQDNESHEASNPAGFTSSIDINQKQPGKYNFYIEAKDKAANIGLAGPHNMYIDPESDLPITSIINPRRNMHVQGNLNIVGIARDDDAVDHVEFVIYRGAGDRGEELVRSRAAGAEFWSYFLDTSNDAIWSDGVYTLVAWAVDINGLSGINENFKPKAQKKHMVSWNLDRKKPDTSVESHEVGALVAGKIRLRGTVFDGNGVNSLRYAIGENARYQPVSIKYDKKSDIYNWDINIDTKTLEDGPAVVWFQARDGMGTLGVAAHLLFVNNTSPEVQIVYPAPDVAVNGVFSISGYATHPVGIKSVSWKLGKDTGEFPLVIGNSWWAQEFDIRNQKVNSLDLEIRAEDLSGNVTLVKRKLAVDQNAGLPKITLEEPTAGLILETNSLKVRGLASDNDAVISVLYSVDSQPAVEIPSAGYFRFTIPDLPAGVRTLDIWAKDYTGIEGPKVQVKGIVVPGSAPEVKIASLRSGSGKNIVTGDFYSGMAISSESGTSLEVQINSGNALQSVSYQLGARAPVVTAIKGSKGGDYTHIIPINPDIDYGQIRLEIKVIDVNNLETILEDFIYIPDLNNQRVIDGHVSANKFRDGPITLRSIAEESSWPSQIVVERGRKNAIPVYASYDPAVQVSKAIFTIPGRSPINGSAKNGEISANLPADLPAELNTVTLAVTLKTGEAYSVIGEFWILRPRSADRQVNNERGFTFVRPEIVSQGGGERILLSTQEALIGIYNGGRPLISAIIEGESASSFNVSLDEHRRVRLQALTGGMHGPLRLALTDRDGRESSTRDYYFIVDSGGPELELTLNPDGTWVQNEVNIAFHLSDANGVTSAEISLDLGDSWRPLLSYDELAALNPETLFERTLDISSFEDGMLDISIRARNVAGRTTTKTFSVQKDTKPPVAELIVPISGARVNGIIRLGIGIKEAGSLEKVTYHRPEKENGEDTIPAISTEIYPALYLDKEYPPRFLDILLDFSEMPLDENMFFEFEDKAGNRSELRYMPYVIDNEMDVPTVHIILPLDNEIITADFEVSGIMYDDDQIKQIYWYIDDDEEKSFVAENGFSVPIRLSSLTDNEHTVTVIAEDIYGVRSDPVTRGFRVSLTEPTGEMLLPTLDTIVRETIELSGIAFDENGIDKIQISLDNGNTFNDAYITTGVFYDGNVVIGDSEGKNEDDTRHNAAEWVYQYNTTIFQDGSNVVFFRIFDNYGIMAIYASLVNLDNTPPEITLDFPGDGAVTTGPVYVTGRAIDVNIDEITIELRSLDGNPINDELRTRNVTPSPILMERLNLSGLEDGLYNIEVWAIDKAKNISRASRNVELARESNRNFVEILYPLEGEHLQGTFNLYGNVGGIDRAQTVTLRINEYDRLTADVSSAGYYHFSLDREMLNNGWNQLVVHSNFGGSETVLSKTRTLYYQPTGAWVTIDSLDMGDFAYERPWFTGRAGYVLSPEDAAILEDKKAEKEILAAVRSKTLNNIEISFDNGNTFVQAGKSRDKNTDWRYRLETGDMYEGIHYILVRANMDNGETAITRTLIQVDKTPPFIRLIAPQSGGHYNQELEFAAMSSDNVELAGVSYHLRKGDKAAYEVPGFLQGLYFEVTIPPFIRQITNKAPAIFAGGVSYMDFGLGLSFFDDNVKLQLQYGFMTQSIYEGLGGVGPVRYGGHILGIKLLANIYSLPFGSFAGPDWEWLSASFAIGANFSLFDLGRQGYTQSGQPTFMSALVAQIEFPKVTIPKRKNFRTFSMFTEGQLWFVPTDVDAKALGIDVIIPHIIVGLRLYIF
jgi:hypothetical protein